MRNWQDEIVRFRCALVRERQDAIRALNPAWRYDDVSSTVTQVSFADFPEREAAALSAIPTRLKLPGETIDQLIAAGTCAVNANLVIGKFAAHQSRDARTGFDMRALTGKTSSTIIFAPV